LTDTVSREMRSRMMSGIRGRNTNPELTVRRHFHAAGLRFSLHSRDLPGRPDLVLPRYGAVVLVHGCFWHQHPDCRYCCMPKSNRDFWAAKLASNVERDVRQFEELTELGWRVFVVWECEVDDAHLLDELANTIREW
jgi:DNA mismatch endonuclease (patch repair protein)